jgi:cold shock CspA family protein
MQENEKTGLVKIGVFYDGNYFLHVSNYYNYVHERRNRISISGLHEFIRHRVGALEQMRTNLCQIVDAHYFRGRLSAKEASQRGNQLYYDRVFDDILMSEGVVTHYLPLRGHGWKKEEKGIDVWLALEAFELAIYKQFSVVVLIACDGDYVPLVRKLNTLGIRVMILSWDFEFTNHDGKQVITRTSQDLLKEASYPVSMHEEIDRRMTRTSPQHSLINGLFVMQDSPQHESKQQYPVRKREQGDEDIYESEILSIKTGYGFIKYPNNNLFFYHEDVEDVDFNELREGDLVSFTITNSGDKNLAKNVRKIDA